MSNSQGSGKQGRKARAPRTHEEAAAGAPGRSEHQPGESARPSVEEAQTSHRPAPSRSSQAIEEEE
jgi:hypothetical protein